MRDDNFIRDLLNICFIIINSNGKQFYVLNPLRINNMRSKFPTVPFWETKSLNEMSTEEWESLCDGCARCCLHKIEDEDSGEIHFTNIACRLLDLGNCQCLDYAHRFKKVSDCLQLTPEKVEELTWLPKTCAYRRVSEGWGLARWHPLVSGNKKTVIEAGISVSGKTISEKSVNLARIENWVVDWID